MDLSAGWFAETLAFAQAAHAGQIDKGGHPYADHVERVARRVAEMFPDATREQVQAALLHDVIEDTDVTVDELQARFGPRVAAIVAALTKPLGAVYTDYISNLAASGDIDAVRVKLADNLDNSDPARAHPDQARMVGERYAPARAVLEAALAGS